jgi:RING finger protein 121
MSGPSSVASPAGAAATPAHNHASDESAGRVILYSLITLMIVAQVAIIQWRARHPKSYNLATLLALWLFPPGLLLSRGAWSALASPFLYCWLLFSALMAALLASVRAQAMAASTPGVVYGVLESVYLQLVGVTTFVTTTMTVLFVAPPLAALLPETALTLLIYAGAYAVYFAVLARDVTGVITDVIVARLGSAAGGKDRDDGGAGAGSPPRAGARDAAHRDACALCAGKLHIVDEGTVVEEGGGDEGDAGAGAAAGAGPPPRPVAVRRADGTIVIVDGRRPPPLPRSPDAPATLRFESADGKSIMFQLTCKHVFHRTCLAGWAVVGKKGVCPTCSERVDLSAIYADSPLIGKTSAMFSNVFDLARYLVVFNPIIFFGLRLVLRTVGTLDVIEAHAKSVAHVQRVMQ